MSGTGVFPSGYKTSSALHASVGVQREIARDFVLSADFAYRHFVHLTLGGAVDLNHFNSIYGPVIPKCTATQRNDPQAICSLGPINVQEWEGRATYKGLLLRADKRFSHGFQVLGSYAYSSNTGTINDNGFNLDNWLQNAGPLPNDLHQHPESRRRGAIAVAFRAWDSISPIPARRRSARTSAGLTSTATAPRATCCREQRRTHSTAAWGARTWKGWSLSSTQRMLSRRMLTAWPSRA